MADFMAYQSPKLLFKRNTQLYSLASSLDPELFGLGCRFKSVFAQAFPARAPHFYPFCVYITVMRSGCQCEFKHFNLSWSKWNADPAGIYCKLPTHPLIENNNKHIFFLILKKKRGSRMTEERNHEGRKEGKKKKSKFGILTCVKTLGLFTGFINIV